MAKKSISWRKSNTKSDLWQKINTTGVEIPEVVHTKAILEISVRLEKKT